MTPSKIRSFAAAIALGSSVLLGTGAAPGQEPPASKSRPEVPGRPAATPHHFARWEKEIAAYGEHDRANPPTKGAVLFIGSSTIRLWKTLAADFPDHVVINRGFGGSEIADATYFANRIIFPYEPRQIFLRAGGNDIHAGRLPDEVAADFADFVRVVHGRLPNAEIVYIAVNPRPRAGAKTTSTATSTRGSASSPSTCPASASWTLMTLASPPTAGRVPSFSSPTSSTSTPTATSFWPTGSGRTWRRRSDHGKAHTALHYSDHQLLRCLRVRTPRSPGTVTNDGRGGAGQATRGNRGE